MAIASGLAAYNAGNGTTTMTASAITTAANVIMLAVVSALRTGNAAFTVSGVTGGGLTWNRAFTQAGATSAGDGLRTEVWWALAPSISTFTTTATFASANTAGTMCMHGYINVNQTTPFNQNIVLKNVTNYTASNVTPSGSYTTTAASTFSFGTYLCATNGTQTAAGSYLDQTIVSNTVRIDNIGLVHSALQDGTVMTWTTARPNWQVMIFAMQENTDITGPIDQTFPTMTMTASGSIGYTGTSAQTFSVFSQAMIGTVSAVGGSGDPPTPDVDTDDLHSWWWTW